MVYKQCHQNRIVIDHSLMSLSRLEIEKIAEETVGQYKNEKWYQVRKGKLLTSNFLDAVNMCARIEKTKNEQLFAFQQIIKVELPRRRQWLAHNYNQTKGPALEWGLDHESDAIREYEKQTCRVVKPTGIWLFPSGNLGGSPDGLVYEYPFDEKPAGIIEAKCPFSMRHLTGIREDEWPFYLTYLDRHLKLKTGHNYYHTVMGNLEATQLPWCDFVIWTPSGMLTIRINALEEMKARVQDLDNYYVKWMAPRNQYIKSVLDVIQQK